MIYIDTCVIIALIREADDHHQKAVKVLEYATEERKKIVTAESVFIKEFFFQREKNGAVFNEMNKEEKKDSLTEARNIINDIFSNKILPLQENRKVCFAFQDIVVECDLKKEEIKRNVNDINHLAHCVTYECSQYITFDDRFINLLKQRGFDFNLRKLEIINDVSVNDLTGGPQSFRRISKETEKVS